MSTTGSDKPKVLVQLDSDPQPSVFDGVVAVDAGVDQLFRHGAVTPENVRDLVYGALFTRGPADLHRTAIFVGGSKVLAAEAVLEAVKKTFFGPFRVSVLFDANGSNTTAAGAVLAALEATGGSLHGARVAILAGTGPVGQRITRLVGRLGASVVLGSRDLGRASALAERLHDTTGGSVSPFDMTREESIRGAIEGAAVIINCGPTGVRLLPHVLWRGSDTLKALIDLNAVPPLGIEGVEANDKDKERSGVRAWGALGVGRTKMKIHRRAVQELFAANDRILDAEEVLELGTTLE
jgi:hypothetical protein